MTEETKPAAGGMKPEQISVASATAKDIVPITRARGRPFARGNKLGGKPKGSRNKVTMLAERLVAGDAEDIVQSVINSAKKGNGHAIAAVMNIICPPRRGRSVRIDVGRELDGTAASLAAVTTALLKATVDGLVSGEEAQQIGVVVAAAARAYELDAIEQRLEALEGKKS